MCLYLRKVFWSGLVWPVPVWHFLQSRSFSARHSCVQKPDRCIELLSHAIHRRETFKNASVWVDQIRMSSSLFLKDDWTLWDPQQEICLAHARPHLDFLVDFAAALECDALLVLHSKSQKYWIQYINRLYTLWAACLLVNKRLYISIGSFCTTLMVSRLHASWSRDLQPIPTRCLTEIRDAAYVASLVVLHALNSESAWNSLK